MPILNFANPLFTFSSSNKTFTATKECYLTGDFAKPSTGGFIYIDGTKVAVGTNATTSLYIPPIKLQAGNVVTIDDIGSNDCLHIFDIVS